jgi:uncharacterized membrane protein
MKTLFKKIKSTFISGVVLFLPIFILLALFQKVYGFMYGFGHKLTGMLGLNSIEGFDFAPVLTTILLIVIFYLCGLLVRFSRVTSVKEWIENSILVYIPNYSKLKAKMMTKLQPGKDLRKPALVEISDIWKPGFLVSSENGKSTVFMPSTPDTDYGEVWIVDSNRVKELNMTSKELKTSLLMAGKGLKYN